MIKSVWVCVSKTVEWIHQYASWKYCNTDILVGAHAWLLMNHLQLLANFSGRLDAKFIVLYQIVSTVGLIDFHLKNPLKWKTHDIFYMS